MLSFPIMSGYSLNTKLEAQTGKNSSANAEDPGSIPGSGRSPGRGHGNPPQCSRLENPVDRGAQRAAVQGSRRVGHARAISPPPRRPHSPGRRGAQAPRPQPRGKKQTPMESPARRPLVSLVSAHFRGSPPRRPDHQSVLGPGRLHPAFAGSSSPALVTGQGLPPSGMKATAGPALPFSHRGLRGRPGCGRALAAGAPHQGSRVGEPRRPAPSPRHRPLAPCPQPRPRLPVLRKFLGLDPTCPRRCTRPSCTTVQGKGR